MQSPLSFGELVNSLQLKSGFNDPAYRERWNIFINEALREHARVSPWAGLEDVVTVTADGGRYLILPPFVDQLVSLLDTTNSVPVMRAGDWDRTNPVPFVAGTAGQAFEYDKIGEVPAIRSPSSYIWAASSHSSDNALIYVTGLVANSGASTTNAINTTFKEASLTLTGTTPVTLTTLFTKILTISSVTDRNGDVIFQESGSHFSWLGRSQPSSRFKRIQLLYRPVVGTTFEVRFRFSVPKLIHDSQSPPVGVKTDFIVDHALSLHWQEQEQFQKAAAQAQKATKVLSDEARKDSAFDEPHNCLLPIVPFDPYSDPSF